MPFVQVANVSEPAARSDWLRSVVGLAGQSTVPVSGLSCGIPVGVGSLCCPTA